MQIAKILLFLLCLTSISATFAMKKNTSYSNSYDDKSLINLDDESSENYDSEDVEAMLNANPEEIEKDCNNVIKGQKIKTINMFFSQTKKLKNVTVSNIESRSLFSKDEQQQLQSMFVVGENLDPKQCVNLRNQILGWEYDKLTCSDNKIRYAIIIGNLAVNTKTNTSTTPKAASKPPVPLSGWQRLTQLFCNNYREAGFGFATGVAVTLGFIKLYSWLRPENT